MHPWKRRFLLESGTFRGCVSFKAGICFLFAANGKSFFQSSSLAWAIQRGHKPWPSPLTPLNLVRGDGVSVWNCWVFFLKHQKLDSRMVPQQEPRKDAQHESTWSFMFPCAGFPSWGWNYGKECSSSFCYPQNYRRNWMEFMHVPITLELALNSIGCFWEQTTWHFKVPQHQFIDCSWLKFKYLSQIYRSKVSYTGWWFQFF